MRSSGALLQTCLRRWQPVQLPQQLTTAPLAKLPSSRHAPNTLAHFSSGDKGRYSKISLALG